MLQYSETYDWRLSVPNMEKRDSYFTRLRWRIELTHLTEKEKVCECICSSFELTILYVSEAYLLKFNTS